MILNHFALWATLWAESGYVVFIYSSYLYDVYILKQKISLWKEINLYISIQGWGIPIILSIIGLSGPLVCILSYLAANQARKDELELQQTYRPIVNTLTFFNHL